jgi:hypothetical protein
MGQWDEGAGIPGMLPSALRDGGNPEDLKSILERIPATPCRLQADPALGPLD